MDNIHAFIIARRGGAFVVDALIMYALVIVLQISSSTLTSVWLNAVLYLLYRGLVPAMTRGDTVGRRIFGTQVRLIPKGFSFGKMSPLVKEIPIALILLSPALVGVQIGLVMLFTGLPLLLILDATYALVRADGRTLRDLLVGTTVDWA